LIARVAPEAMRQGRIDTVAAWLAKLPADVVASDAWLLYWSAACLLPSDPAHAHEVFATAFDQFTKTNDVAGRYFSWAAAVGSIVIAGADYKRLDAWIERLDSLRRDFPAYPMPQIEHQVATSMFLALFHRQPHRHDVRQWMYRGIDLARRSESLSDWGFAVAYATLYLILMGDIIEAERLINQAKHALASPAADAVSRITCKLAETVLLWSRADARGIEVALEGLELARTSGAEAWTGVLLSQAAVAAVFTRDFVKARSLLDEMQRFADKLSPFAAANCYHFSAVTHAINGNLDRAAADLRKTLDICERLGFPFALAYAHLTATELALEKNDLTQAAHHLAIADEYGDSIKSPHMDAGRALVRADF
jgi:predicted nucleic acid-binding protein